MLFSPFYEHSLAQKASYMSTRPSVFVLYLSTIFTEGRCVIGKRFVAKAGTIVLKIRHHKTSVFHQGI